MSLWEREDFDSREAMGGLRGLQSQVADLATKKEEIGALEYVTIKMGLLTEEDCFKAIKELGDAKFALKHYIPILAKENRKDKLQEAATAIERIHSEQLIIINDVCKRFHVIHPKVKQPTEEMLKVSRPYWDWYKDIHKKVYGQKVEIQKDGTVFT